MTDATSNAEQSPSISEVLAEFAATSEFGALPSEVIDYALLCIADSVGIAFASHQFSFAQSGIGAMQALGSTGICSVIGGEQLLSSRDAAFLNGLLVHGLDYDDTHSESIIHCSASALPMALAQGYTHGASGPEALMAYIVAVEASARLGQVADGMFQKNGFHPTGLVSVFGCTLGAAKLANLTEAQTIRAQGIALSMASGSMQFLEDGAWTKRMHPGDSASNSIMATALAANDFQGPADAYQGRYGLYPLYLPGQKVDVEPVTRELGHHWELLNIAVKPYPVCHFNHACIDSVILLMQQHNLDPGDIQEVTALLHENQFDVVCKPAEAKRIPTSDYDAKFSIQYCIAAAAVRGEFGLAELEPDALRNKEILALAQGVNFEHREQSQFPEYFSGGVRIKTSTGEFLEHYEPVNRGAAGRALSTEEVRHKFNANMLTSTNQSRADDIWQAIMALPSAATLEQFNHILSARG
ncbi:MAG: MmgE/PrpD family protein [Halioglobus sp.]